MESRFFLSTNIPLEFRQKTVSPAKQRRNVLFVFRLLFVVSSVFHRYLRIVYSELMADKPFFEFCVEVASHCYFASPSALFQSSEVCIELFNQSIEWEVTAIVCYSVIPLISVATNPLSSSTSLEANMQSGLTPMATWSSMVCMPSSSFID